MKEVTVNEVKNIIDNAKGFTAVFWYSHDCPVCEQFLGVEIPKVENEMTNWNFYKINFEDHVKANGCYFEAAAMPMGYFFKDNSRLFVGDGFAPGKEVINLMRELESPEFKTETELERDQLQSI